MTLRPFCVKINLGPLYKKNADDIPINWIDIISVLASPLELYLQKKTKIRYKSLGIHDFNEKGEPHIHLNYIIEDLITNPLSNYKYFFSKLSDKSKTHFKHCKHTIKHECYGFLQTLGDDVRKTLAYPMKECIDPTNMWKAPPLDCVDYGEWTQLELISLGSGIYLAATEKYKKQVKAEEAKMEKWCNFCKYMDELRETPTKHEMSSLRGICVIALNYYRELPERTSVNAVITMCKDYAFKRNIWTNEEILDKYQII